MPFWEANSYSTGQKFVSVLWNRKFRYHVYESPSIVPCLRQMNPAHVLPSCFCKIYFNYHPSMPMFFELSSPFRFSNKNPICVFRLPRTCHMPRPLHRPSFVYLDGFWWGTQFTKLHIAKLQAENWTEGLPSEASCWRGCSFVLLVSSVCYFSCALQAAIDGTSG